MSGYRGMGGGGFPYRKPASSGNNMNAVPPPPMLNARGYVGRGGAIASLTAAGALSRPGSTGGSSSSTTSKHGYSTLDSISQYTNATNFVGKRKQHTDDDYFDDDDEPAQQQPELEQAYIPAPGSPGAPPSSAAATASKPDSDSDEDPLEQFMAGINQQVEKEKRQQQPKSQTQAIRGDIDDEDDEESYYRYMKENPNAGLRDDGSDQEVEYDEDGNPIAPPKRRISIRCRPSITRRSTTSPSRRTSTRSTRT